MFRTLNKFAFPSAFPEAEFAPIKDPLQQKAVDLTLSRGFKVPTLPTRFPGQPPEVDFKALGEMRLSGPAISPTVEREVLKLHSPVADNIPAQLKHRFLGTPRRALHNVVGALSRHPYLTAAGAGAAALGVHQYLKHRAARQQAEQAEQAPEQPKMAALVPPPPVASIAPRPPVPGDIKMPKPSTKSPIEQKTKGSSGTASSAPSAGISKAAFDPAIAALLAAAAGGTGGYFFGKKVLEPLAGGRVDALKETISEAEKAMGRWETVKEFAPAGAAAAGAILLAALAANHARKSEREKLRGMTGRSYREYDPNGSDYSPDSREMFHG
jgi:hypothetical protein